MFEEILFFIYYFVTERWEQLSQPIVYVVFNGYNGKSLFTFLPDILLPLGQTKPSFKSLKLHFLCILD